MKPDRVLWAVEEASALQRRLYRAVRETMRAMAGRLSGVALWEAKKLLARHIWLDAGHADALRERVLELRYPRVDVDTAVDPALRKEEVIARTQREVELWKEWIADKHRTGQHGYEAFLPRLEAKCARMPAGAPGALQAARLQRRDHVLRCVRMSAERLTAD